MNLYRKKYSLFKRGRIWYFWYYSGDKRKMRSTRETRKVMAERFAETYVASQGRKRTILEVFAKDFFSPGSDYLSGPGRHLSLPVIRNHEARLNNHILPAFGGQLMQNITARGIEKWLHNLNKAEQTKKHILNTFRIVLKEAEKDRLIERNPADVVSIRVSENPYDVFTADELKTFLDSINDVRYRVLFSIMATTGIRTGEVRSLCADDVLADRNALLITKSSDRYNKIVNTKAGEDRAVYVPRRVMQMIGSIGYTYWLFEGKSGRPITQKAINAAFDRFLAKSGVESGGRDLVPHSLRHTYNTMLDGVVPDGIIRATTGHRSEKMRRHYTHKEVLEVFERVAEYSRDFESTFNFL